MKTILHRFQWHFCVLIFLTTVSSWAQVQISTQGTAVVTNFNGWNGTLPTGYERSGGSYVGTNASTTGGAYAISNSGFGFQASSNVTSSTLTGTYRNTSGAAITQLVISYNAFKIVDRASRTPGWAVTSSAGNVSALDWAYNDATSNTSPTAKTTTLTGLNIAVNATFTITFSANRGGGSGSSPLIGLNNISIKAVAPALAPTVSATTAVTAVTENGAASGGTVSSNGGAALTAKGVVWSTSATPVPGTNNYTTSPVGGSTADVSSFTVNLVNLLSNTHYYYRAYASNADVTGYGTTYDFYTHAFVPGTPVADAATLNTIDVTVNAGSNNAATTYAIQEVGGLYVQENGTLGGVAVWKTAAAWNAAKTVSGLTPDTQYTFKVKARNGAATPDETAFSATASARTLSASAPIFTLEDSSLNFDTVCINNTVTGYFTISAQNMDQGLIMIAALNGYSYSLTENGTFTPSLDIESYTGLPTTVWVKFAPAAVQLFNGSIVIDGLNDANDAAQLTLPVTGEGVNTPGTVVTVAATGITEVAATLAGTLNPGGCTPFTTYGIDYSTTSAGLTNGNAVRIAGNNLSANSFSVEVSGLMPYTTYYFRAYGTDGTGEIYSTVRSFTTVSLSTPVTVAATTVGQSGFTANWNAVAAASGYRLDVSTSPIFQSGTYATDLFISEYVEGTLDAAAGLTNSTRAIEIYNGTGHAVNLEGYTLRSATDGSSSFSGNLALSGTLQDGQTYVVANSQGGSSLLAVANLSLTYSQDNIAIAFTGNDAIALYKNETQLDVVGPYNSGNWGMDITLRRKKAFNQPTTSYNASQWQEYPVNTISGLGNHESNLEPFFVTGYENLQVNATSQNVTGLESFTTYYYRVRAYSGANSTPNSNVTNVTTKVGQVTWTIPSGQTTASWTPATYPDNTPAVVDETVDVVINADYATAANGSFRAGKLTLNAGSKFTVSAGTTLTLANTIVNNAGADKFIVENNGALLQTTNVQNTGSITLHKLSNPLYRLDYTMWSSPVAGQNLQDFSPYTVADRFFEYRYGQSNGTWIEGYWPVTPANHNFEAAKGYLIRMPNTNSLTGYFEGTASLAFEGKFTGVPNNGNISIALSTENHRYTAVGNPYPSPISVAGFFEENQSKLHGITGLYLWRKRNNSASASYATLTKAGFIANPDDATTTTLGEFYLGDDAETGNWLISQGQGFIVKAAAGQSNPQLNFTNSMRRTAPGANQGFFRTTPGTASKMWLNLKAQAGNSSQALIAYMDQGTAGLDYGYDGLKLGDGNTVTLYSIAENTALAIQARPAFDVADVVPMGYNAPAAGQFTISMGRTEGLFTAGQAIYLKDNAEGIVRNISDRDYTFTSAAGTFDNRFEVLYTNTVLNTDNPVLNPDAVIVYKQGNNISIATGNTLINRVTIFDINGRQLYNAANVNATETAINNLNVARQVLIVEIDTVKGKVSKRIVY